MALLQQSPDVLCQLLLQSLSAPDKMVRTVASVTFRRLANYLVDPALSMWPRLDPTLQASTKQLLLQIMMNEQEPSLRHKHGELVSSLAKNLMGEQTHRGWLSLISLCMGVFFFGLRAQRRPLVTRPSFLLPLMPVICCSGRSGEGQPACRRVGRLAGAACDVMARGPQPQSGHAGALFADIRVRVQLKRGHRA